MTIRIRMHAPCILLVLALARPASAQNAAGDWYALAASLKPGTRIGLDLSDGTRVEGTVLGHEGERFVFSPKTRIPVDPWRIDYDEIRSLEIKKGDGLRPGTKVLIGVGVGFGILMMLTAVAIAAMY